MADDLAERVRTICGALPDVTERPSHGAPTWFASDKRSFVTVWTDGHHDIEYPHLWVASTPETQQELIAENPDMFFRPPYVGHRGWIGIRLDSGPDWQEIAELIQDAHALIASRRR